MRELFFLGTSRPQVEKVENEHVFESLFISLSYRDSYNFVQFQPFQPFFDPKKKNKGVTYYLKESNRYRQRMYPGYATVGLKKVMNG